jgi:hypothetical protein
MALSGNRHPEIIEFTSQNTPVSARRLAQSPEEDLLQKHRSLVRNTTVRSASRRGGGGRSRADGFAQIAVCLPRYVTARNLPRFAKFGRHAVEMRGRKSMANIKVFRR